MFKPDINELKEFTDDKYNIIPVSMEILSDIKTPIEVLKILKNNDEHCFFFLFVEKSENWGRYSFLGFKPSIEITCRNNKMRIKEGKNVREFESQTPQNIISELISQYKSPRFTYLPTFTGGLVGYFAYDFIKYFEPGLNLDAK